MEVESKDKLLDHINPSVGTKMFDFFGILTLLNKLNKNKNKIICSPLSNISKIPQIERKWDNTLSRPQLHLFINNMRKLKKDILFEENITECINSECEFIIISLYYEGHRNYIIINNKEAYRIEPLGHESGTNMDDIDKQLVSLFKGYGIVYIPHSELPSGGEEGFPDKGLQKIGDDDGISEIIFPGYCNTYVFLYIEEICKYHDTHPDLSGIDLFRKAMNHIHDKISHKKPGYTEKRALKYNRELQEYQHFIYSQLIESKPLYKRITRLQKRKREEEIITSESRLENPQSDPIRELWEDEHFNNASDIFFNLPENVLNIYGIDFSNLSENDSKLWKHKSKKRKINKEKEKGKSKKKIKGKSKKKIKGKPKKLLREKYISIKKNKNKKKSS